MKIMQSGGRRGGKFLWHLQLPREQTLQMFEIGKKYLAYGVSYSWTDVLQTIFALCHDQFKEVRHNARLKQFMIMKLF